MGADKRKETILLLRQELVRVALEAPVDDLVGIVAALKVQENLLAKEKGLTGRDDPQGLPRRGNP